MPGPPSQLLPSSILPSSTFGGFEDTGRDIARQRRRRHAQTRREHKTRTRRAMMLPSEGEGLRSSQAENLSGSIDNLTAHSAHAYGHGSNDYPQTTRSPYGGTR